MIDYPIEVLDARDQKMKSVDKETAFPIRVKLTERDCPRCDAVLINNENEQCCECLNCGYIDCGDE